MTSHQQHLRRALEQRIKHYRDLGGVVAADGRPLPGSHRAIAVLYDVVPTTVVTSAVAFAASLPAATALSWQRSLTRTIFLAGDPVTVADRYPPWLIAADQSIAWYQPAPAGDHLGIRRLLRPFRGPAGVPPSDDAVGSAPMSLVAATSGLSVEQYLVHLNHLVAESTLAGHLTPGTAIKLDHVAQIRDLPSDHLAARVMPSADGADLTCHAYLRVEPINASAAYREL